jgi:hypothetical protein
VVFEDLDEDGVRDEGEMGISRVVKLFQGGMFVANDQQADGSFAFDNLEPGTYSVEVDVDEYEGFILESVGSHNPIVDHLQRADVTYWNETSPSVVEVTISGGSVTVDFGAVRADLQTVRGGSFLNDDWTQEGTQVVAHANGLACGQGEAETSGGIFDFVVAGEDETAGCASDGDVVSFTIGGQPASETFVWNSGEIAHFLQLTAMPDHAWYWLDVPYEGNEGALGATAEAVVGGKVCGQAVAEQAPQGFTPVPGPLGFSRLIVPRDTLVAGCGTEGAMVSFQIAGQEFATATWETGVHALRADSLPAPAELPKTGGG